MSHLIETWIELSTKIILMSLLFFFALNWLGWIEQFIVCLVSSAATMIINNLPDVEVFGWEWSRTWQISQIGNMRESEWAQQCKWHVSCILQLMHSNGQERRGGYQHEFHGQTTNRIAMTFNSNLICLHSNPRYDMAWYFNMNFSADNMCSRDATTEQQQHSSFAARPTHIHFSLSWRDSQYHTTPYNGACCLQYMLV